MAQVRLMVWVHEKLRKQVKAQAAAEGVTLREFVVDALIRSLKDSRNLEPPVPGTQKLFEDIT